MSDETPQPLRLKPRVRPATEAAPAGGTLPPPAAPAEAPAAAPAAADNGAAKLRLKPKLAAEPATPAAAPAEPAPPTPTPAPAPSVEAAPPAERPRLKPRLTVEPPAAAAQPETPPEPAAPAPAPEPATPPPEPVGETPAPAAAPAESSAKFKLKPKTGESTPPMPAPPPTALPEEPPAAAATATPPVKSGVPKGIKILPPVVHIRAPEGKDEDELTATAAVLLPPHAKYKRKLMIAGGLLTVIVLAGVGYYLWLLRDSPPDIPPPAAKPTVPAVIKAKPADTPSETLNKIAAMPGAMIDKAQNAIAERRNSEQNRVDAGFTGEDTATKRAIDTPLPGHLAKPAPAPVEPSVTRAQSTIAPGVTATTTDVIAGAEASAAFRVFVGGLQINGVFQGNPPRALINGRTFRKGELVDVPLGIVFESADAEKKIIVFKDRTGAIVSRRY